MNSTESTNPSPDLNHESTKVQAQPDGCTSNDQVVMEPEATDSNIFAILDAAALQEIQELIGSVEPTPLIDIIDTYLETSAPQIAQMKEALPKRDYKLLLITVHSLKSSSATVGATRLAELCSHLETALRQNDDFPANTAQEIAEIAREHQRSATALECYKVHLLQR